MLGTTVYGTTQFGVVPSGGGGGTFYDPVVNAGADQTLTAVTTSTSVTATASDPDGGAVTVVWSRVSGPNTPTIVSPTALTTNITGLVPGTYVFRCTATDDEAVTAFDDITVRVNRLPVVNAGTDQSLSAGVTSTTLTGTATDADGDTLTKTWSRISGPNTPTITTPTTLSTTVTGMVAGTYIFRLTVNDGVNANVTDDVQVLIATPANLPPVVVASGKTTLYTATSDSLTATATDPENQELTYLWTLVSGPNTPTMGGTTTATLAVSGLVKGVYTFNLAVSDGVNTTNTTVVLTKPRVRRPVTTIAVIR